MKLATEISPPRADTFNDLSTSTEWCDAFIRLQPGRELDATIQQLSRLALTEEQYCNLAEGMANGLYDVLWGERVATSLSPDTVVSAFRQLARALQQGGEHERADILFNGEFETALTSVIRWLGAKAHTAQILEVAELAGKFQIWSSTQGGIPYDPAKGV